MIVLLWIYAISGLATGTFFFIEAIRRDETTCGPTSPLVLIAMIPVLNTVYAIFVLYLSFQWIKRR